MTAAPPRIAGRMMCRLDGLGDVGRLAADGATDVLDRDAVLLTMETAVWRPRGRASGRRWLF